MEDRPIVAYFEAAAEQYDGRIKRFIGERELRAVRTLLPEGSHVLDFGCGTGRTTLDLLRRGCRVTAYDVSPAMLGIAVRRARERKLAAEFVTERSALAGRAWPFVTCIGVLDYYRDARALLRSLDAYLAPGGRLVVSTPSAVSPLGWIYAARGRLAALPVMLRTTRSLERIAARAGFVMVDVRRAFPQVWPLALTIVASLARATPAGVTVPDQRGSNLFRRRPVESDAPTARALE